MTLRVVCLDVPQQERTGVKMVMIQDGPLPTGADKPLRITGDPFKVQVRRTCGLDLSSPMVLIFLML